MIRSTTKRLGLEALAQRVVELRGRGATVVMCHGVFDLVHVGHIRHFEQARRHGDVLIVTVTPDRFVNKGSHRPAFTEALRAEAVAALGAVDYVAINRWPTAAETIRLLQPHVYCKGDEYRDVSGDARVALLAEIQAVEEIGGRIEYTHDLTFSSSRLINSYLPVFSTETDEWLRTFRERHSIEEVLGYLQRARELDILVVGEAILDEYVFCDGLGKSSKDPILAFRYHSAETHAGGSVAVANHLAGFCRQVRLVTQLGETERREDFIRLALLPNVRPHFVTRRGAPTIHKRRFVDNHTGARMFELYVMHDEPLEPADERELVEALDGISDYDLVVVADYGHGLMTPAAVTSVCSAARFMAVNTQANAGNRGFNTISKYPRADYVCLAGYEVALETRMRHASWRELVMEVAKRIDAPRFTVTLGKSGSLHWAPDAGFTEVPALATRVMDRVGAGDAVLAVTSLMAVQGVPWDIVGLVGNVAGAQMVADLGNRVTINQASIAQHLISLMK
ncbi:MAG: adenylyltransferase/cytidyltransferase family protein [Candidatus Rokubacteria bacterium]|nr:adenylyltransferase/cytidyltransferase family protein [Candidatus Rokubacteria bacterium]